MRDWARGRGGGFPREQTHSMCKVLTYLSVASDNSSFICSKTRSAQGVLSPLVLFWAEETEERASDSRH